MEEVLRYRGKLRREKRPSPEEVKVPQKSLWFVVTRRDIKGSAKLTKDINERFFN